MKTIYFGFSRSSTRFPIFSWLIMASEHTNFSHCYIKFHEDAVGGWIYYQASHSLVNCMTEQVFLAQEKVIHEFEFEISDEAFARVKKFMLENMGKPYGVKSIFGYAWMTIASWFGLKVDNPLGDGTNSWVCSEFAAAALSDINVKNISARFDDITPQGLYNIVKLLPKNLNDDSELAAVAVQVATANNGQNT